MGGYKRNAWHSCLLQTCCHLSTNEILSVSCQFFETYGVMKWGQWLEEGCRKPALGVKLQALVYGILFWRCRKAMLGVWLGVWLRASLSGSFPWRRNVNRVMSLHMGLNCSVSRVTQRPVVVRTQRWMAFCQRNQSTVCFAGLDFIVLDSAVHFVKISWWWL